MKYKGIALFAAFLLFTSCSGAPAVDSVDVIAAGGIPAVEEDVGQLTQRPEDINIITITDDWQVLRDAKLHYAQAMIADEMGDTLLMQKEFESALLMLGEIDLAEESSDALKMQFEATTSRITKDYQLSIRKIRLFGAETSASTLMEKLELFEAIYDTTGMAVKVLQEYANTIEKDIPLQVNEKVRRIIRFYQSDGRKPFELWLKRAGIYREMVESILEEEEVPKELFYLAMVESGLNPKAYSWAHASGLWQFISATGKRYGLKRDWWVDERRNPVKSTYAAARYLKDLHKHFGDWYLAMAAYNAGEGRVDRAIRREKTRDFWEMETLPRQTRNYVPSFIAATLISENPAAFGFDTEPMAPLAYDEVSIKGSVDMDVLAEAAGVTESELVKLNPELRRRATPARKKGFTLRLPPGVKGEFEENFAKLPESKKTGLFRHRVSRGETLSTIAQKYGISLSNLVAANSIRNRNRIRAGSTIMIPTTYTTKRLNKVTSRSVASIDRDKTPPPRESRKVVYRVKKGDTLGHIAEYFRTTAGKIRGWNGIRFGRHIYPGQQLSIYVPAYANVSPPATSVADPRLGKIRHTVSSGESLTSIAAKYRIPVGNLMLWNNLRSDAINRGQKLTVWTTNGTSGNLGSDLIEYVVKRGDTLWDISRTYSVTIPNIVSWNPWASRKTLRPGDKLKIYAGPR